MVVAVTVTTEIGDMMQTDKGRDEGQRHPWSIEGRGGKWKNIDGESESIERSSPPTSLN